MYDISYQDVTGYSGANMELRELVSFYHVARLRSVSKAARTLELGQPTVTTHLRKLESEFGITLFDRIKRPIQLTSEGSTLLELVTPVVTSIETLKSTMDYAERRGSFQVGAYPDLIKHHMPLGVREFTQAYPEIRIQMLARPYSPLMQLVNSGEIDLAFCSPPPPGETSLEFQKLFDYNILLMMPKGHPLAQIPRVALEDIAGWPLILTGPDSLLRSQFDQRLRSQGLSVDVMLSMDDTESMKRYVEIGMGVAVAPDFVIHPEDAHRIDMTPLGHILPGSSIGICTLKGKFAGQGVRNFMDLMSLHMSNYHADIVMTQPPASPQFRPPVPIIDDA